MTTPKVASAFGELLNNNDPVKESLAYDALAAYPLGYRDTADDQLSLWTNLPPQCLNPNGEDDTPNSSKRMDFPTEEERDIAYLVFAGRWGYLWWLIYGDNFHVTKYVLESFPAGLTHSEKGPGNELVAIASELSKKATCYATMETRGPKGRQWRIGNYDLHPWRHITDEADLLLAKLWGVEDAYEAAGNLRDRMVFGNKE